MRVGMKYNMESVLRNVILVGILMIILQIVSSVHSRVSLVPHLKTALGVNLNTICITLNVYPWMNVHIYLDSTQITL